MWAYTTLSATNFRVMVLHGKLHNQNSHGVNVGKVLAVHSSELEMAMDESQSRKPLSQQ